jgi:short-subunit dehydrogenase
MSDGQPLALVTGASSGIGATFARRLSGQGYRLILVARRAKLLEDLARDLGGAEVLVADLTVEDDLRRVEARIDAADDLELLVNNAGFGVEGRFFQTPAEGYVRMHQLHVMATLRLSHAALRGMVRRGKGALINVSSVAGFSQSPGTVSYCATKAWMTSFTMGLHLDLLSAGSPVRVQALCPGFTYSEFHDVLGADRGRVPKRLWCTADDVVTASLTGLAEGKVVVIPGLIYRVLVRAMRWVPQSLYDRMAVRYARRTRRIGELKGK